jgi:hypothetical protein
MLGYHVKPHLSDLETSVLITHVTAPYPVLYQKHVFQCFPPLSYLYYSPSLKGLKVVSRLSEDIKQERGNQRISNPPAVRAD